MKVPYALVVDDDALIRMDACALLEEAGFALLDACDADAAHKLMEVHHAAVQLLFTDAQMPGSKDGFALARGVSRRWPHVGILVASGQLRPRAGDMPEGAVFIEKPFSTEVVRDRVREILPEGQRPEVLR